MADFKEVHTCSRKSVFYIMSSFYEKPIILCWRTIRSMNLFYTEQNRVKIKFLRLINLIRIHRVVLLVNCFRLREPPPCLFTYFLPVADINPNTCASCYAVHWYIWTVFCWNVDSTKPHKGLPHSWFSRMKYWHATRMKIVRPCGSKSKFLVRPGNIAEDWNLWVPLWRVHSVSTADILSLNCKTVILIHIPVSLSSGPTYITLVLLRTQKIFEVVVH
jgi:hypothetical protein